MAIRVDGERGLEVVRKSVARFTAIAPVAVILREHSSVGTAHARIMKQRVARGPWQLLCLNSNSEKADIAVRT